jgi:hypothetical protein
VAPPGALPQTRCSACAAAWCSQAAPHQPIWKGGVPLSRGRGCVQNIEQNPSHYSFMEWLGPAAVGCRGPPLHRAGTARPARGAATLGCGSCGRWPAQGSEPLAATCRWQPWPPRWARGCTSTPWCRWRARWARTHAAHACRRGRARARLHLYSLGPAAARSSHPPASCDGAAPLAAPERRPPHGRRASRWSSTAWCPPATWRTTC